jgi:hypothetical protein
MNYDYLEFYKDQVSNIQSQATKIKGGSTVQDASSFKRIMSFFAKDDGRRVSAALRRVDEYSSINTEQLHLQFNFDEQNSTIYIIKSGR